MKNPLCFSAAIGPAIYKAGFAWTVLRRMLQLLLRRDRQLVVQQLDYRRQYQFEQSFLVIRYQFKHALWYHFEGIRKTTKAGTIALNLQNIPAMPLILTVQGLFHKKSYPICIVAEQRLETQSFRTGMIQTHRLQPRPVIEFSSKSFPAPASFPISVHCPAPAKLVANIKIVHPSFH